MLISQFIRGIQKHVIFNEGVQVFDCYIVIVKYCDQPNFLYKISSLSEEMVQKILYFLIVKLLSKMWTTQKYEQIYIHVFGSFTFSGVSINVKLWALQYFDQI